MGSNVKTRATRGLQRKAKDGPRDLDFKFASFELFFVNLPPPPLLLRNSSHEAPCRPKWNSCPGLFCEHAPFYSSQQNDQ